MLHRPTPRLPAPALSWPRALRLSALLPISLACSGGSASDVVPAPAPTGRASAVRFLNRATFGASPQDTDRVAQQGHIAWLDSQFAMPPSLMLPDLVAIGCAPDLPGFSYQTCPNYDVEAHTLGRVGLWWEHALAAPDQLRQRVAFALSEILVVSDQNALLTQFPCTLADYYDTLSRGAFGNYRDLLEDVTLHPAMGAYLSMAKNRREDPILGTRPDENFAREVMQLFSIGLSQLDVSGNVVLDPFGDPIPTYDQQTIKEMARALTGWTYWTNFPGTGNLQEFLFTYPRIGRMQAWPSFHDSGAKTVVGGVMIPAAGTPEQDLDAVLDALATHPNVGPFISKQLIQRLVTSNPSPEYVARISAVWNDDGMGVRGNLAAVVRALLLDSEALNGHTTHPLTFGKIREPLLRVTGLWRAFEAVGTSTTIGYYAATLLGQRAQSAPHVFNFFSPSYTTTSLNAQGLVAPELEITTHSSITRSGNILTYLVYEGNSVTVDPMFAQPVIQIDPILQRSLNVSDMLDALDERMCGGVMSDSTRQTLETHINQIPYLVPGFTHGLFRTLEGISLLSISPDFAIQQ
jgi:uncharacterized protein (DUF1800 family)